MCKGMMDFNLQVIFAAVRDLAEAFGPVRLFENVETKDFQAPRFCAEYFPVKSADETIAMSTDIEAGCQSVSTPCVSVSASLRQSSTGLVSSSLTDSRNLPPCLSSRMSLLSTCD